MLTGPGVVSATPGRVPIQITKRDEGIQQIKTRSDDR